MKFLYAIVIILAASLSSIEAQEKKWTLEECMRYAVDHSPRRNKQTAQNSIYNQNYMEAIGKLLPSVNATTSASFNFGRSLNSDNTYADVNAFNNDYGLYSSLTLFDGLANINRIKMQKMSKLMGKEQLQEIIDKIAYETMESYFTVLYNSEMVKLAAQQLEESSENVRQVRRMEELGVKGFPDVAEMQAKEAADNYNLTKQKNLLTISIIQLKEKMNFPIDEELTLENYSSEVLIAKSGDTPRDIYKQSLGFLPKAMAAEAAVQVKERSYKTAKGAFLPTLSVDAGYSTNFFRFMDGSDYEPFRDQFKNKVGKYIGFTLKIPIFNGFSRSVAAKKSKAELIIARNERDETLRTIYSEIEQAVTDMNGQVDEYYQAGKQVEAMSVAHDVNQRKYKEGLVSALELHTSSNRLLESKVEELNSRLKFYLKHRLVNYYKGEAFIK